MSDLSIGRVNAGAAARPSSDLYRAVWRWHFYAGLLVLPFMITLAVTGALYLFREEIDAILHADLKKVEIREDLAMSSPSSIVAAALAAYPGDAVKFTDPAAPDDSAEVTIAAGDADKLAVYVDPYTGAVLGSLSDRGTVMWTVRYLHSLRYFGSFTRAFIEIAGGWAILLVGTGLFLWWPRKQKGGVVTVRGKPATRVFWRDTHAVTGLFVGFFIVFLAVTGMPWSGVWGSYVNEWANGTNFGYPSGVYVDVPMSDEHLAETAASAWSLEQAQLPESGGFEPGAVPMGLDEAVNIFDALGIHPGYAVSLPSSPTGVYSASVYPDDLSQQRIVHLDQYTGESLIDMRYDDYGPLGRWLEWGINVHMGQQFGLANQLVLVVVCLAIVLLAVSAGTMWWKRRPSGSIGVPAMPDDPRVFRGLLAILVVGGILFPLVGLSLILLFVLDWIWTRTRGRRTV